MYKKLKYELAGVGKGLMMANIRMASPFDSLGAAYAKLQSKRGKNRTEADVEEMQKLLFMGSFYLQNNEPGVPEEILIGTIANGCGYEKGKLNTKYRLNIRCPMKKTFFPLIYAGPKNPKELWEKKSKFAYTRLCEGRLKTNVIFPEWKVRIEIEYNDLELDEKDVINALVKTGEDGYLMGWRRGGWGKFEVKKL